VVELPFIILMLLVHCTYGMVVNSKLIRGSNSEIERIGENA